MALGEASVRILPDVSDFEKQLLSAVQSAMSAAQSAVDDATAGISGSFDAAATEAESALSSVDGDGFSGAVGAADAAAGEVAGSLDGAASEADAALSSVDGGGFAEATGAADRAASEISGAMEEAAQKSESAFKNIDIEKALGGAVAGAAVIGFTKSLVGAAEEAQVSAARINQIATSMGVFGDEVSTVTTRIQDYASATAEAVGVDDDAILAAQAKLLTFKNLAVTADDVGGAFDRATMAALDLAAAGFGSAESNAIQLGKALQDPIKGITALARAGVTFTATEKERIRVLVESNQIGEAQRLVLQAIEQQVGGTAQATATSSGKMLVAFDSLQESLGAALLPAMETLVGILGSAVEFFDALPEPVQKIVTVVGLAAAGFYAASRALQGLGLAAGTANKALGAVGLVLSASIAVYSVYAGRKKEAAERTQQFVDSLNAEAGGQDDATTATLARIIADSKYLQVSEQLGISQKEVADAIKGNMGPALREQYDYIRSVIDSSTSWDMKNRELQNTLGISAVEAYNFTKELDQQRKAFADAKVEIETFNQTQANLTQITGDASIAQARLAGLTRDAEAATIDGSIASGDYAEALSAEEQAAQDAEAALRGYLDAVLSSFNSQLQLEDATYRTRDAAAEYQGLLMQVIDGTYKGTDAAGDLAKAQNDAATSALSQAAGAAKYAEDQAKASGASFTAADSYKVQRDELIKVANQLDPNSPLRKQLLGYASDLTNKIPREIATKITATLKITPIDASIRNLMEGRTAEGGVFSSPQTRLIAEAGQEAVIPISRPARAMELMELSGLADMVRGNGGGAMVNIQQATFASATDADLVAQRVNAAYRARAFAG